MLFGSVRHCDSRIPNRTPPSSRPLHRLTVHGGRTGMKFVLRVLVFLLCCTPALRAQETERAKRPAKIGHYIHTHKELLIADAVVLLAWSADAASSVHCQHVSPYCVDSNSVVGPHPSNAATWGFAESMAVGLIVGEHLFWWQANKVDPEARHIILLFPAAVVITQYWNVSGNVAAANRLENARSRVMAR